MKPEPTTKANPIYEWRQIRRWNEIGSNIEIAGEHKRALEKEVERTSDLLMAYCYRLADQDTAKADELQVLHWSKLVPSVYPGVIATIAKLNGLLEEALKRDTPQSPGSET